MYAQRLCKETIDASSPGTKVPSSGKSVGSRTGPVSELVSVGSGSLDEVDSKFCELELEKEEGEVVVEVLVVVEVGISTRSGVVCADEA